MAAEKNQGVVAGLGTGTSLLAAVACLAVIASAVVAFRGWSGVNPFGSDGAPLVLADASIPTTSLEAIGLGAGEAATTVSASPTLFASASAPGSDSESAADVVGSGGTATSGGPPADGSTLRSGGSGSPQVGKAPYAGEPDDDLFAGIGSFPAYAPGAGRSISDLGVQAGAAVGTINKPLGDAISAASTSAGSHIGGLQQPVEDALDVIPPPTP